MAEIGATPKKEFVYNSNGQMIIRSSRPVNVESISVFGLKNATIVSGMKDGTIESIDPNHKQSIVLNNCQNIKYNGSKNAPNFIQLNGCNNVEVKTGNKDDEVIAENCKNNKYDLGLGNDKYDLDGEIFTTTCKPTK